MRPGCAGLIKFKKVHNVDSQKRDEWGTLIADTDNKSSSDYDGTALYERVGNTYTNLNCIIRHLSLSFL